MAYLGTICMDLCPQLCNGTVFEFVSQDYPRDHADKQGKV